MPRVTSNTIVWRSAPNAASPAPWLETLFPKRTSAPSWRWLLKLPRQSGADLEPWRYRITVSFSAVTDERCRFFLCFGNRIGLKKSEPHFLPACRTDHARNACGHLAQGMQAAGKLTRKIGHLLGNFIAPCKAQPLAFEPEVSLANRRLFRPFCTRRGLRRVLVAFARLRRDHLQHDLLLSGLPIARAGLQRRSPARRAHASWTIHRRNCSRGSATVRCPRRPRCT